MGISSRVRFSFLQKNYAKYFSIKMSIVLLTVKLNVNNSNVWMDFNMTTVVIRWLKDPQVDDFKENMCLYFYICHMTMKSDQYTSFDHPYMV